MTFIDEAEIFVKSGNGGNGCLSFERSKNMRKGPANGGNGGNGGDIVFLADSNLSTLYNFKKHKHFKAENGQKGGKDKKTGKSGENLKIKFPLGTQIFDANTGLMICDLSKNEQEFSFAKGGRKGLGNSCFQSSTNQKSYKYTEGDITEEIKLILKLKTLSDIAIIGLPNAGKSSLISKITAKQSIVADYPFTTINPQLGVINFRNNFFTITDIPGLVKGASTGKGLGHKFLKHIERCKILLHMVDISEENFVEHYKIINKELELYSKETKNKMEIICLNKIDKLSKHDIQIRKNILQEITNKNDIFILSLYHNYGINHLVRKLWYYIKSIRGT
ncbi:MAG: GTPase ObgE [Rickettsia sp.]|nr:GTPase ObgE [Rickettsia sp.]